MDGGRREVGEKGKEKGKGEGRGGGRKTEKRGGREE